MARDKFLKGALILTVAGVMVKVIGAVSRIVVSRMLGGEGIGLYQMAYPIYLLTLSVSSAGIPVAISIMVSEKLAKLDYRGAHRIFRLSLLMLASTGILFTVLLYLMSGWLIDLHLIRDPRAYYAMLSLAPAIFFVTVLSSYRGYFQGSQMMTPTATSQIVEQILRVVTMISLVYILLPQGVEFGAAGASFGACPGAVAALIVLLIFYYRQRKNFYRNMREQTVQSQQESVWSIIYRLVKLAIPVSMASIVLPLVDILDLLIVPARLEVAGFTVQQATELYGYLTGMGVTLLNLPTILTMSLAVGLVPAVSEAHTLGRKDLVYDRAATAMRLALLVCLPSFVGLWLLSTPISQMLFGTPNAGVPIAILSVGVVFLGIQQVTTGVLQGLSRTFIPFRNLLISASVKIVLAYTLTAMPWLGVKGAAWASVADFAVAAGLNLWAVGRLVGFTVDVKETAKAVFAVIVMGIVVKLTYHFTMMYSLHNTLSTSFAILCAIIAYGIGLMAVGGIRERDVRMLPKYGPMLADRLNRLHILKR